MLAKVKFTPGDSFFFTYAGMRVYFSNMRWNRFFECWVVDYREEAGVTLTGLPIRSGINIVQGIGSYLPSLYAINALEITKDPQLGVDYSLYVSAP